MPHRNAAKFLDTLVMVIKDEKTSEWKCMGSYEAAQFERTRNMGETLPKFCQNAACMDARRHGQYAVVWKQELAVSRGKGAADMLVKFS